MSMSRRRPLVLSGGPAVGKTTCGRLLVAERKRGAYIDADDVRQLVVSGAATLWSGKEGRAQHELAARNVAALARNFADAEFDVVISDLVTSETLAVYRAELPEALVVQLALDRVEARSRSATRREYLTPSEFSLLHDLLVVPPDVDLVIGVAGMSISEQVEAIRGVWAERSKS
ncbi:MAG: hypothetical protein QM705_06215 [Ancrocorticia sp.]